MQPKIISEKIIYKGYWHESLRTKVILKDKEIEWESVLMGDIIVVVAIEDGNVYLCKEWRPAWKRDVITIPVGGIEYDAGEARLLEQARNELREEIKKDAKNIIKLSSFLLANRIRSKVHIYLATNLFDSPKKEDEDEIIEVLKMPVNDALELFKKEEVPIYSLGLLLAKEKLKA